MESVSLNVGEVLSGKRVLFTGCTGFLGKVTLSMLLHRYGEQLGRVHVLVRKGSSASAQQRFFDKVVTGEPFAPIREARGEEGALEILKTKCAVHQCNIASERLGLSPPLPAELRRQSQLM